MTPLNFSMKIFKSIGRHYSLFGFRGVVRRCLCAVFPSLRYFKILVPNSSKPVVVRLGTTDVDAYEQVFIKDEYRMDALRQPAYIIDAGANIGMSSVFFSLSYPDAKIIAIEPDHSNYSVLVKNVRGFPNVVPINIALWSHNTRVSLSDPVTGHWGVSVVGDEYHRGSKVDAKSLSAVLKENNIAKVDLLKVDIEGSELELFSDASNWIDRIDLICIELHDRFRPGCSEVFEEATLKFPVRWRQGELVWAAREGRPSFVRSAM